MGKDKTTCPRRRGRLYWSVVLLLGQLCACSINKPAPEVTSYFYVNPNKSLYGLGRVALVELDNHSNYPQVSADMTQALYEAIQKRQLFGLRIVRQDDPDWRSLQVDTASVYTLEQLVAMRDKLRCNGIMIGTVTVYQPYPHMTIGLMMKLVDLTDGQLVWAVEQVWDATDKLTEKRVRHYFQQQLRTGSAPMREELVCISPLSFERFVAYEVAQTLQPQRQTHSGK